MLSGWFKIINIHGSIVKKMCIALKNPDIFNPLPITWSNGTSDWTINIHHHTLIHVWWYGWWKWLSWQFTDKLNANLWSVDGESDCRDSLLTNSMQNIGE